MVKNLEIVSLLGKSDHCRLVFNFITSDRLNTTEERSRIKMNYFKGSFGLIRSELKVINLSEIFEFDDIMNVCWNIKKSHFELISDLYQ